MTKKSGNYTIGFVTTPQRMTLLHIHTMNGTHKIISFIIYDIAEEEFVVLQVIGKKNSNVKR